MEKTHTVLTDPRRTASDKDGLSRVPATAAVLLGTVQAERSGANCDRDSRRLIESQVRQDLKKQL